MSPTRRPMQGTLLAADDIRAERGWKSNAETERALLKRSRDAARLELRGASYSAEDRAEVAAEILTAALAALPTAKIGRRRRARIVGSTPYARACAAVRAADDRDRLSPILPSPTDVRQSLTVYCGRAANARVRIDRERARHDRAGRVAADAAALSLDGLAADAEREADADRLNAQTAADAARVADVLARRLSERPTASLRTLLYSAARVVPSGDASEHRATVCAELDLSPQALDKRCHDARRKLAAETDAASMLRALTSGRRPAVERRWRTVQRTLVVAGPTVTARITDARLSGRPTGWLAYLAADLSRPAVGHADTPSGALLARLAADWREGTASIGASAEQRATGTPPPSIWPDRIALARGATDAERAAAAETARSRCKLTRTRKRSAKLAAVSAQTRADALANLGRALQPNTTTTARRWTPVAPTLPATTDARPTGGGRPVSVAHAAAAHARYLAARPVSATARDWLTEPLSTAERRARASAERKRAKLAAANAERLRDDRPLVLVSLAEGSKNGRR